VGSQLKRDHKEALDIGGRIVLKYITKKFDLAV
jgi:hypothetical protein